MTRPATPTTLAQLIADEEERRARLHRLEAGDCSSSFARRCDVLATLALVTPGTGRCDSCGRALGPNRGEPAVGASWDGQMVRAVGICARCGDPTVTLNCVTVHQHHHCDTHAPEVVR